MQREILTTEQRRKVSAEALAAKHGVTASYVRYLFRGKRECKSPKAIAIVDNAKEILRGYGENV